MIRHTIAFSGGETMSFPLNAPGLTQLAPGVRRSQRSVSFAASRRFTRREALDRRPARSVERRIHE
jgi:hypothetical protein